MMPLAGGFLKRKAFKRERKYPLEIYFCENCYLVQIGKTVPRRVLFSDYKYLSSVTETLRNHFELLANKIMSYSPKFVVEIGCNDGVLLSPLRSLGIRALGVEPAHNVAERARVRGLNVIEGFFGTELARKIVATHGYSDLVTGSNVFAHIENIVDAFKGVANLLAMNGILIMEVHYVLDLLAGLQYDFFYHEHIFYYSLLSLRQLLRRVGLEVFRVERLSLHGGSIRVFASVSGSREIEDSVHQATRHEIGMGLDRTDTYLEFSRRVIRHRDELYRVITKIKSEHSTIAGYGASGRATTLLNFLRLPAGTVTYIVDDSPARQDHYLPGIHVPIFGQARLNERPPDYVLLLAWSYEAEIRRKTNKPMIVPFPKIRVIGVRK